MSDGTPSPAVSVILPTFNRPVFTRAAVQSVLGQSFRDWELLIADDGSAAETRAYLERLADPPRIRVLTLAHTGNPPAVRNAALRQARGEYVAFLDSDDVWLPEKLQAQVAALRARTERAWSYTAFTLVDAAGEPLTGSAAKTCPAIEGPFLEALLRGEPLIMQSSVAVRRELLEKVGGYDEELRVLGDYALWIRLAQHSEIGFIDAPLVRVRRHLQPYFDEVTALEELGRMLERVRRSGAAPGLDALLRQRRARAAAGVALAHSRQARPLAVLGALLSSAPYSWRYGQWWSGALRAAARALVPQRVLDTARKYRSTRRTGNRAH